MSSEIWKYIESTDEQYMISNLGRVMSMWRSNQHQTHIGKPHILKPSIHRQGYLWVRIKINGVYKMQFIHRLVAQAFIPNPKNLPEVNHKDEDKANNCVENLEWCTGKYNSNYGTRVERHREMVSKPIIQTTINGEFIKEYKSATEAEKECGYDSSYISMVCNGRRPSAYGYKWHFKKKIDILIEAIADLLDENKTDEELEQ